MTGYKNVGRLFQSTPSVWRETQVLNFFQGAKRFQSTPSVWRETRLCISYNWIFCISIHSLRMEGDRSWNFRTPLRFSFQSTPSVWRETLTTAGVLTWQQISIHSLRMEGDWIRISESSCSVYFNPLPPYGGRLSLRTRLYKLPYFNPLPPYGGRRNLDTGQASIDHFNPLPPYGGRRADYAEYFEWMDISIHSLRMEGDLIRG